MWEGSLFTILRALFHVPSMDISIILLSLSRSLLSSMLLIVLSLTVLSRILCFNPDSVTVVLSPSPFPGQSTTGVMASFSNISFQIISCSSSPFINSCVFSNPKGNNEPVLAVLPHSSWCVHTITSLTPWGSASFLLGKDGQMQIGLWVQQDLHTNGFRKWVCRWWHISWCFSLPICFFRSCMSWLFIAASLVLHSMSVLPFVLSSKSNSCNWDWRSTDACLLACSTSRTWLGVIPLDFAKRSGEEAKWPKLCICSSVKHSSSSLVWLFLFLVGLDDVSFAIVMVESRRVVLLPFWNVQTDLLSDARAKAGRWWAVVRR